MGNCLDVPSPPPKDHNAHYRYSNGIKHSGTSHRSRSISTASVARMSDSYSLYQPYPPYYNQIPPRPMIMMDPNTGQSFAYPPPMPIAPFADPRDFYADNYYDYYDYGADYDYSKKKKKRSHHNKIKEIGGLDKNANRKSTLITTFPDATDDVIVQGNNTMPSRVTVIREDQIPNQTTGQATQEVSTVITTETAQRVTSQISETIDRQVDIEEIQLRRQEDTTPVPVPAPSQPPKRGSTYVTYIKDVPVQAVVQPVEQVVQSTSDSSSHQVVETVATVESVDGEASISEAGVAESENMFVERSGPVEDVNKLLVDEPLSDGSLTVTETTMTTSNIERTTAVSSKYIGTDSGSLFLQGRLPRSDLPAADVVVIGSFADEDIIRKISENLQGRGISVFSSMASPQRTEEESITAGQMIVEAKILVIVLSVRSCQSGQLRDEVSLASVSNTVIFPVAIDQTLDILDDIDVALKLQVASYKWVLLRDPEHPIDIILDLFANTLMEELEIIKANPNVIDEDFGQVSTHAERRFNLMRRRQMMRMITRPSTVTADQFWNDTYPDKSQVEWSKFRQDFMQHFRSHLNGTLPRHGQLRTMDCLRRELINDHINLIVTKGQFIVFCTDEGQDEDLWEKFMSLARENLAIRDVFDVESSVRLVAIQNIGRFGSPAVMSTLRDQLSDQDANIRAVATISLSRCISLSDEVSYQLLLQSLDDGDRLVREAGCIAMGHLKATGVVSKLTDMWRNDVISQVRAAAQAALEEIGGDRAGEALRVTQILADEIRRLT